MSDIKVAIIGCGNIATEKHIPNLLLSNIADITALFDTNIERAIEVNNTYLKGKAKVYDNYQVLLQNKEIEVVHICTPNAYHAPMSIQAMEQGKHVMCEKPMAMNAKEAKEMVDVSKKTNRQLGISLQNRFRKDSLYLKKMIDNNELGDIYYAKAHALRRRAVPVWGDFLNKDKQGGGSLIDIGVHALDLTLWLMGKYDPLYVIGKTYNKISEKETDFNSFGDWEPDKFTVEESGFAQIIMKDGSLVNLETSWALNTLDIGEAKTTLHGSKAGADMKDGLRINGARYGQLYTNYPQLTKDVLEYYDDSKDNPGYIEMKTWMEAIKQNKPYSVLPEQVYVVTKIIEGIYESSKQNKPIYIGD